MIPILSSSRATMICLLSSYRPLAYGLLCVIVLGAGCRSSNVKISPRVAIEGTNATLEGGKASDEAMLDGSSGDVEIVRVYTEFVDIGVIDVVVETRSSAPISAIQVSIEGNVYEVGFPEPEPAKSTIACDYLFETEGYACTEECLTACGCLECPDPQLEGMHEDGCATVCSSESHYGFIGPGQDWDSEYDFAHETMQTVYDILIEQGTDYGCSTQICEEQATEIKESRLTYVFPYNVCDETLTIEKLCAKTWANGHNCDPYPIQVGPGCDDPNPID